MSQSKFGAEAFSQGDIMRRLRRVEQELTQLRTARSLQAAAIGAGGLRIRGGLLTIQDTDGSDMFRAGGDPGEVFIREDILTPFAVQVLASRLRSAAVEGQESTTSTTFTDLDTEGPIIDGVEVVTGVALVFVNAGISGSAQSSVAQNGGAMSFEVSGATEVEADLNNSRSVQQGVSLGTMGDEGAPVTITRSASMTIVPLNPGFHTFRAQYRALGSSGATGTFNQRSMAVLAL